MKRFDARFGFLKERLWRVLGSLPVRLDGRPVRSGSPWGKEGSTGWFRAVLDARGLPADAHLRIETGAEGLLYADGVPVQGVDPNHAEFRIPASWRGRRIRLEMEAYAGHAHGGCSPNPVPDSPRSGAWVRPRFLRFEIAAPNANARALYVGALVLRDLPEILPPESLRRARIEDALERCLDGVDWGGDDAAFDASLRPGLALLRPLLARGNGPTTPVLHATGHSHIDVAWLWTVRESVRKCARTFSTADRLMGEYPEYRFLQSQAALYEITKRHWPAVWRRILARVKERRWEANGAMWVEPDCNVPSGESLVRQFLVGKAFFRRELGVEADVCWLPDAFGFSAALPQILKGCGVPYFATHKLEWNDTNRFPYDTFRWIGIDGSEVLAHQILGTYAHRFAPKEDLHEAWRRFRQKAEQDSILFAAGYGDGGGGLDRLGLEMARRCRDLEGVPKVHWGSVSSFFRDLDRRRARFPSYEGELYLECHRGTLTSQAGIKRANRLGELALRDLELWSALLEPDRYPAKGLLAAWKVLLLNQFHDILPGSSYRGAVEEAGQAYAGMFKALGRMRKALCARTVRPSRSVTLFNSLSWERKGVQLVRSEAPLEGDRVAPGLYAVEVPGVPSVGYRVLTPARTPGGPRLGAGRDFLENGILRIRWTREGKLSSVRDLRSGREFLAPGGRGNDLRLHEDLPANWDAWDIDRFHLETGRSLPGRLVSVRAGRLFAEARFRYAFGRSRIDQSVRIRRGSMRIDFATDVLWRESHKLLKVRFQTAFRAGEARYEIQFGHLKRAAHENTPWERARFEACAHTWVDCSEPDAGAALLNDSKYGHSVVRGAISLSLLKSSGAPDPVADRGRHAFTYAFLPHEGGFGASGVIREAHELNAPLEAVAGSARETVRSFVTIDAENVVLAALKRSEDGRGTVLRLYEALGRSCRASVRASIPHRRWTETDLLERAKGAPRSGPIRLGFRPFEIKTLVLA